MTEQYQQTNVNQQRPARFVDQSNIDTTLTPPAIPVGNDVTFVLLGDAGGPPTPYQVNLPNVQTVQGFFFYFLNENLAPVTVAAVAGQVIDGNPTIEVAPTEVLIIVSDPTDNNTTPPTPPIGWTLITNAPI